MHEALPLHSDDRVAVMIKMKEQCGCGETRKKLVVEGGRREEFGGEGGGFLNLRAPCADQSNHAAESHKRGRRGAIAA